MSELGDIPEVFRIPFTRTWADVATGLLARIESLQPGFVVDLRITAGQREVAWVTISRSLDDIIEAIGPHGPYASPARVSWVWQAVRAEPAETAPAETAPGETNPAETAAEARNERELERARQVARTVLDYVRTLDGVPSPDQFLFEGAAQFRTWSPESESPAPTMTGSGSSSTAPARRSMRCCTTDTPIR